MKGRSCQDFPTKPPGSHCRHRESERLTQVQTRFVDCQQTLDEKLDAFNDFHHKTFFVFFSLNKSTNLSRLLSGLDILTRVSSKEKIRFQKIWRRACMSGCVCVGVACMLNCLNQFEAMLVKSICTCTFIRGSVTGSHWFSSCLKIPSQKPCFSNAKKYFRTSSAASIYDSQRSLEDAHPPHEDLSGGKSRLTQPAKHLLCFLAILLRSHYQRLTGKI